MVLSIEELYEHYLSYPIISTDSRAIINGSIFFALKGENFDGNDYVLQSLKNGCSLAVVDDEKLKQNSQCAYVDDVLSAMQLLAQHHRNKLNIPIIGITGTNGKTTTKELANAVLSQKYQTYATKGNFNNHIGVPLSILEIDQETEIAIIEMGANHIGEIADLCQIAKPTHGLITNIGIAHLEGFGNFNGVIKAKTELYHFLKDQANTITFVNYDDDILMSKSEGLNRLTYGISKAADTNFSISESNPFASISWHKIESILKIQSQLIGNYNASNMMAGVAIGKQFRVSDQLIIKAINEYLPKNQRSQLLKTDKNQLIVDAYNANPSSMSKAIDNFVSMKADNKLLILGDMLELGKESETLHQKIVDRLIKLNLEKVILVGSEFKKCLGNPNWKQFESTKKVYDFLTITKIEKHSILLKGSRGMQLEKLIEKL